MIIYFNDWKDSKKKGLEDNFEVKLTDEKILFANYTYEYYSGNAYVLFTKGKEIYEVFGSHCSCYGLEDQWKPERLIKKMIKSRIEQVNKNDYQFSDLTAESKVLLINRLKKLL